MEHIVALPQYDVLAYLIAGLAAIAVADLIFGTRIVFRSQDWGVSRITVLIVVGYVGGQIIGVLSTWLMEQELVNRGFGSPTSQLMRPSCDTPNLDWPQRVVRFFYDALPFVGYFEPLECNTQNTIIEKLKANHKDSLNEPKLYPALFWEAYNTAKQDTDAFERIVTFHREYSVCRNMSFVSFLAAFAVIVQRSRNRLISVEDGKDLGVPRWLERRRLLLVVFLFVGAALFARYLYFYRAHSIEVFTSYGYAVESKK